MKVLSGWPVSGPRFVTCTSLIGSRTVTFYNFRYTVYYYYYYSIHNAFDGRKDSGRQQLR
jgi:hypothetical protein